LLAHTYPIFNAAAHDEQNPHHQGQDCVPPAANLRAKLATPERLHHVPLDNGPRTAIGPVLIHLAKDNRHHLQMYRRISKQQRLIF
jgi:hypothetical protein